MPAEVRLTKEQSFTGFGLVALAELLKDIYPEQAGRPICNFAAEDDLFGLFGFEDSNDLPSLWFSEDAVTTMRTLVFKGGYAALQVCIFEPTGMVPRLMSACFTRRRIARARFAVAAYFVVLRRFSSSSICFGSLDILSDNWGKWARLSVRSIGISE
jgi:hypothetical protein